MEYLVFPFGKYKGVLLKELPSTYIVLALESFDLPKELQSELFMILMGRFNVFSGVANLCKQKGKVEFIKFQLEKAYKYE